METVIFGIDPGSVCTGYGVVQTSASRCIHIAHGSIRPKKHISISDRLHYIYENILTLIKQFNPQHLVIEKVFVGKNASAALKLGQARSCALIAAATIQIPVFEYTPCEVKQAVTGYGAAVKSQIQHMITHLLQIDKKPAQDAADALAIALCHANVHTFNQKIRGNHD
jgi:crossover junction endodeoxyribonuclease RuvC